MVFLRRTMLPLPFQKLMGTHRLSVRLYIVPDSRSGSASRNGVAVGGRDERADGTAKPRGTAGAESAGIRGVAGGVG